MNAIKMDYPTIDFSLEMKDWQVVRRILASHSPAGATGARDPRLLSDEKWNQVLEHASQLVHLPLWINDSASLSLRELGARTRLYKKKFGIKLVLVDYLRLVKAQGRDLRERVTNIAEGLAQLAKEEDLSIVALSQLSRPKASPCRSTSRTVRSSTFWSCNRVASPRRQAW